MRLSEFYCSKNLSNETNNSSTKKVTSDLVAILDIVRKINSSLKVNEVLESVLSNALKITNTYRGFIVLIDESDNLAFKLGLDKSGKELKESSFKVCDLVIKDVFNKGESIIIAGANDATEKEYLNSCLIIPINTIICSPLIVDGKKIGVIYVDAPEIKDVIKLDIAYTFEILAGHAAIALNNATIHQDLETAHRKTENAERLKNDFLTLISHEIRNPLNFMMTHAQLLQSASIDLLDDEYLESFDIIQSGGRRLLRSIELVLNTSEINSGNYDLRREEFNIIENVLKPLHKEYQNRAQYKKNKFCLNSNVKGDAKIFGDNHSIFLLFAHLVDNAVKFTENGEININIYTDDETDSLKVEIQDTGIGIAEEYIPKIYEQFTQEETGYTRSYDGMGLGLALVKSFCNLNGLTISVESDKNVGTTFTVEL